MERIPGWNSIGEHFFSVLPPNKQGLLMELITSFEMKELTGKRFSKLSMGQKNRANIIRYLIQDFDLLITDESLANVDEPLRNKIIRKMKEIFPSKTFIYISHNVLETARYSKNIFVLPMNGVSRTIIHKIKGIDEMDKELKDTGLLQEKVYEVISAATRGSLEGH
jgi:ABC-type Mn2+/Zn2+ transport system ATPase subunit